MFRFYFHNQLEEFSVHECIPFSLCRIYARNRIRFFEREICLNELSFHHNHFQVKQVLFEISFFPSKENRELEVNE